MLEEVLAAGWEFGKPLLQAGFQRAGERSAPGPYLQAPGARQEAAASLYGAPQTSGAVLDPRQGGDRGQQLQAAKFIIDSAIQLGTAFSPDDQASPEARDKKRATTYDVKVYSPEKSEMLDGVLRRYTTVTRPDGSTSKYYLSPSELVKDGKLHFGVDKPKEGKMGSVTTSPAPGSSAGTLFAPLDTSFNMPGPYESPLGYASSLSLHEDLTPEFDGSLIDAMFPTGTGS
mgnify:CR=1 FL=1|tara:strand:+ start:1249 stop:1938 length:690 start_codon:yes stop_codon:yes gene_type:complete